MDILDFTHYGKLSKGLKRLKVEDSFVTYGIVKTISDGVANVVGLSDVRSGETVTFLRTGYQGLVLNLNSDSIGVVIFGHEKNVKEGDLVYKGGDLVKVPAGSKLLGKVVDSLGNVVDGTLLNKSRWFSKTYYVEPKAPGILERKSVHESMLTGIKVIDCLIPVGRGQRELIIGDRQTGKTAIALDCILNQQNYNYFLKNYFNPVYCVYVSIGQKRSSVSNMYSILKSYNALAYSIIVAATASEAAPLLFLAPYTGCTMAEYFRDRGQHAVIIYDDLTKHANAYRQMSLLLKRPAGREAYPGDIFYLHSRLLERAAKLSSNCGSGSLTALPVIETQAGNVAEYIPTNVISITDGQIYLDVFLMFHGIMPAVNVGLSVSRVGSSSQTLIINKLVGPIKSLLAQYRDIMGFSSLDDDPDSDFGQLIKRGEKVEKNLLQGQYEPLLIEKQVLLMYALRYGHLDDLSDTDLEGFELYLYEYLENSKISYVYLQYLVRIKNMKSVNFSKALAVMDSLVKHIKHNYNKAKEKYIWQFQEVFGNFKMSKDIWSWYHGKEVWLDEILKSINIIKLNRGKTLKAWFNLFIKLNQFYITINNLDFSSKVISNKYLNNGIADLYTNYKYNTNKFGGKLLKSILGLKYNINTIII